MDIVILGVDLGKNVCSLVGLDGGGRVVLRRRLRRSSVAEFAQKWPVVWWRWKHAAARITLAGHWRRGDTRFG
jgi:hypothetical protein